MPINYERYPSTKYIKDRISCHQQILVVIYLLMCLHHGLKIRCQRLRWEEMDGHIWNLHDFFTQVTDFDNSLQGAHETRNHMDHSKK